MGWIAYKVTFQMLSPLHVGSQKIGNIQQTRPYVTGRALWGAITARLTRDYSALPNNYEAIGSEVHDRLAFSYFYPALDEGRDVWFPWKKDELEFSWHFLGTYASTALADGHAAETASLHETEFIAPRTRHNQPVFLVGYIFERNSTSLRWRDTLNWLQIGSDRGYGWGRIKKHKNPEVVSDYFGLEFEAEDTFPIFQIPAGSYLPAHANAAGDSALSDITGTLEPLLGREWDDNLGGSGHRVSKAQICWTPGAKTNCSCRVQIGKFGVLQKQAA